MKKWWYVIIAIPIVLVVAFWWWNRFPGDRIPDLGTPEFIGTPDIGTPFAPGTPYALVASPPAPLSIATPFYPPYCLIFSQIDISVIWLDRTPGSNLQTFYFKFPEEVGVPGQEPGYNLDSFFDLNTDEIPSEWNYSAMLGNVEIPMCEYKGYEGRLYCDAPLPSGYPDTIRPLSLYLAGCPWPVYHDETADVPGKGEGEASEPSGGQVSGTICRSPATIAVFQGCYETCPSGWTDTGVACTP